MSMKPDVAIVGGSLGGLFAAVLLQRAGFRVNVFERSANGLSDRGAGLAAQAEILDILGEIGRDDVVATGVMAKQRIYLQRDNEIAESININQNLISWDQLFNAFHAELKPGSYHLGMKASHVEEHSAGCRVHFVGGKEIECDLVVGADGAGSMVRDFVVHGFTPSYAGYIAWRGLIPETVLSSKDAAVLLDRFAFYNMPHSQILGYVVAGSDGSTQPGMRRYNWVWYRQAKSEQDLYSALRDVNGQSNSLSLAPRATPFETRALLIAEADSVLPRSFANAVHAEPHPFAQAIYDFVAPRFYLGRVAILGDAAAIARPHTAMGVSKAAGDAKALRDSLVALADPDKALSDYDRRRRPFAEQIALYGRRLGSFLG